MLYLAIQPLGCKSVNKISQSVIVSKLASVKQTILAFHEARNNGGGGGSSLN